MDRRQLADNKWLYYGEGAFCESTIHPNGVVISVCRGPQVGDMAPLVIAEGEGQITAYGKCLFFVDAYDSPQMKPAFREQMTSWFKKNRGKVTVDMLIKSKLLEMALNVANLMIGDPAAHTYSDIARWEEVVRRHVPSFRRRPLELPADLA